MTKVKITAMTFVVPGACSYINDIEAGHAHRLSRNVILLWATYLKVSNQGNGTDLTMNCYL